VHVTRLISRNEYKPAFLVFFFFLMLSFLLSIHSLPVHTIRVHFRFPDLFPFPFPPWSEPILFIYSAVHARLDSQYKNYSPLFLFLFNKCLTLVCLRSKVHTSQIVTSLCLILKNYSPPSSFFLQCTIEMRSPYVRITYGIMYM